MTLFVDLIEDIDQAIINYWKDKFKDFPCDNDVVVELAFKQEPQDEDVPRSRTYPRLLLSMIGTAIDHWRAHSIMSSVVSENDDDTVNVQDVPVPFNITYQLDGYFTDRRQGWRAQLIMSQELGSRYKTDIETQKGRVISLKEIPDALDGIDHPEDDDYNSKLWRKTVRFVVETNLESGVLITSNIILTRQFDVNDISVIDTTEE